MEWPQELIELFDDPLLDGVRPKAQPLTADDRRVKKLLEITEWVETNGRMPSNKGTLSEKLLCRALDALREDNFQDLKSYDTLNLLEL
ncbi:MAG: hypothetical protein HUJ98_06790 [Bacteroidaceae bacterium]|nr:hypothetical protein [Bacteroidaceae bacterium]